MKKLMFLVALASTIAVNAAEMKIGTVDMLKLVRNHPSYETNKALLENSDKDIEKKLDAIKSEGEKLQAEGRKIAEQLQNPMIADAKKKEVESQLMEIQQKLIGIEQRYRSEAMRARQDMANLESNLLKATSDDLKKKIAKYAKANGYDLIIDQTAVPYSKGSLDCTNGILKDMGVNPKEAKGVENESK
ncbi:MAG: OmpH family outer membrane protein [Kiritimatiellae bacterium]|nr:OmpH family outer membrane protein [Kiritimatiellia bacterium]